MRIRIHSPVSRPPSNDNDLENPALCSHPNQWTIEEEQNQKTRLKGHSVCLGQRIFIYKEYKAKSPRFHSADIYPRKQEAVRKTTPELLSAVLRSLLCGVCVYFTSTIVYLVYIVQQGESILHFLNFMQSHVVCCSSRGTTIF